MSVLKKLHDGKRIYGTAFTSTGPSWPLSLRKAGLDFAFIDNEHISMNRADLAKLMSVNKIPGSTYDLTRENNPVSLFPKN